MSENAAKPSLLAKALLAAQRVIQKSQVAKNGSNDHFGSTYAQLPDVIDAVIPVLNEHGVVVIQLPVPATKDEHLALTTTLIHADSGESVSGTAEVPLSKHDPQAYGSAITYCRRYALQAVLGLKAADDDAEAAVGRAVPKSFGSKKPPKATAVLASRLRKNRDEQDATAKAPKRGKAGIFPKVTAASEEGLDASDT